MDNRNQSVSVLITVHDQAQEIREKLPTYLTQHYESDYEVIVIDEMSTDEGADVLQQLRDEYPNLRTTFLPKSNRTTQRRKYALSIGVKASGYEWIIISDLHNEMPSEDTLQHIIEAMDTDADLTLGYFTKKGIKLHPFAYIDEARYHILKAERKLDSVYDRPHHSFIWGRYDFIIVKREQTYNLLNLFQQKLSFGSLIHARLKIFFKNLFASTITASL